MKRFYKISAVIGAAVLALAGCQQELSTEQLSADQVKLGGVAPNPVARGGALRIIGSNLQKVQQVEIPGVEPITEIEVVSEGKVSEIRVIVPVNGPEVGPVSIVAGDTRLTTKADLTYSEPIVFDGFSPEAAMPGDVITVKGDYMNNIRQVIFEGGEAVTEFVSQSRYELKVKVPSSAITGKIVIGDVDESNNPEGKVSNLFYSEKDLLVGDPTVKTASYGVIKAGASVTATGTYLNMIESVNFGGVDAEFTVAEDGTSLTAVLPDTAVDGDLVLVSYAGKEFKAGAYGTLVPSALKIAAETRYKAGLDVTITGKDIDLVTGGSLAGTELSLAVSDKSVKFTIPATAKDGAVTLTLANGKTVDTDAIELVKPVVKSVTPLELFAGDENIIVTGDDLDLVVSATLGGKAAQFTYEDGKIELITDATSVGGKIVLTLANEATVEPAEEITVNYHALVIVKSMPSAEHIGAKVTLTGVNFMLVENIYVGEAKVQAYYSRTDDEVSFVMPWNKIGSYNIYFHLLNGDVEMLATPIEVLLEQNITIAWEGNIALSWGDGGRVGIPASKFDGIPAGAKMRLYYSQKDQTWAQAQVNYGDWTNISFAADNIANPIIPTDIYGWFSDGILDRCTEITLTKDILDNIAAKKGDFEGMVAGIIIQGENVVFTKVDIVAEIPQEVTLWEGEAIADDWANQPTIGTDGGAEFTQHGVKVGSVLYFYITPLEADWKLQIVEGHWGTTYSSICSVGNDTEDGKFAEYNLDANEGRYALKVTEEMVTAAMTSQNWGGIFVLNGDNVKVTKVTVL